MKINLIILITLFFISLSQASSTPLGYVSSWMGSYARDGIDAPVNDANGLWINHYEHGSIYISGQTTSNILPQNIDTYYWDSKLGWLYTKSTLYPYLYSFAQAAWLYYSYDDAAKLRWFYNFKTSQWISYPKENSRNEVVISLRIDDITFRFAEKGILENIITFARKYNIPVDLAVIAKPFDDTMSNPQLQNIFYLYLENSDILEVIAHGYTHTLVENFNYPLNQIDSLDNPLNKILFWDHDEFGTTTLKYQEDHIIKMKNVFTKYNLPFGSKIFVTPYWGGNIDTFNIAKKYGFEFMMMGTDPNIYVNGSAKLVGSPSSIVLESSSEISKQIAAFNSQIEKLIEGGQRHIVITAHTYNFNTIVNDMDELIDYILTNNKYVSKIKFGFISKGMNK